MTEAELNDIVQFAADSFWGPREYATVKALITEVRRLREQLRIGELVRRGNPPEPVGPLHHCLRGNRCAPVDPNTPCPECGSKWGDSITGRTTMSGFDANGGPVE